MTPSGNAGGYDTPETVLKVTAAERVPGLFDVELYGPEGFIEQWWDLTVGQVQHCARQMGARVERVG